MNKTDLVVPTGEVETDVLALPVEEVQSVVGRAVQVCAPSSSPGQRADDAKPSPGMVDRHYAPGTPMRFFESIEALDAFKPTGRWALLYMGEAPDGAQRFDVLRNLSESGDLAFAAAALFSTLSFLSR